MVEDLSDVLSENPDVTAKLAGTFDRAEGHWPSPSNREIFGRIGHAMH